MAFATLEMQTSMSTPNWHTGHPQTWCHFPMGEVTFGEGIWVFKYWHFWNIFMTYSTRGAERSGKCQRSCETTGHRCSSPGREDLASEGWAGSREVFLQMAVLPPVGSTLHVELPHHELVLNISGDLDQLLSLCLFTTNHNPPTLPCPQVLFKHHSPSLGSFFLAFLPQP